MRRRPSLESTLLQKTFAPGMQSHLSAEALMQKGIFNAIACFSAFAFLGWANAFAQQVQSRTQRPGGSADGTLTVTATVVSSTGLVIGPYGQLRVIVANATEPGN